jgi:hypothetical protein
VTDLLSSIVGILPVLVIAQVPAVNQQQSAIIVAAGVVLLAAGLNQVLTLVDRFRARSIPRVRVDTSADEEPRRRGDCLKIHQADREWIRRVESEGRNDLKETSDKLNQRIDTLHISMNAQFNNVAGQLGRICGRLGIEGNPE